MKEKNVLMANGLSSEFSDFIINQDYRSFASVEEMNKFFNSTPNDTMLEIISCFVNEFTLDEAYKLYGKENVDFLIESLNKTNTSIDELVAYARYSNSYRIMSGIKRGELPEQEQKKVKAAFYKRMNQQGFKNEVIDEIDKKINSLTGPLHDQIEELNNYLDDMSIMYKYKLGIKSYLMDVHLIKNINTLLKAMDEGLSKPIDESIIVYRAMKYDSFEKRDIKISSLLGKNLSEIGYTSTSPFYDTSFAKYEDYDIVFEIKVPAGTEGKFISQFSYYGDTESEFLLNPNNLYITDINNRYTDRYGKVKTIVSAICLSKNLEHYKDMFYEKAPLDSIINNFIFEQDLEKQENHRINFIQHEK